MTQTPTKKLTVQNGDTSQTLVMSYGMLGDVLRLSGIQDPNNIAAMVQDIETRDLVIRRLFTDLPSRLENIDDLVNAFDLDLSPDTVDEIVVWVMEHLRDFLERQVRTAKAVFETAEQTPT